ncbi:MAG: BMP family ABC transporter substrate-binding protein [Clostridia bacterium]|nr:BMP family ABC transporter substrate-binding protein [Clostridia bacterium]
MKKAISLLCVFALLCGCFGLAAYAARPGDMDADNKITAGDARTVLRAAVGLEVLTPEQFAAADADHDNKITASDARLVLRSAVDLESLDPAPIPDTFKAGFIFLNGEESGYDKNFIDAALDACAELGLERGQFVLRGGVPESEECYEVAKELAEDGCDIIFADSFGHEAFLRQAAEEYPDVLFCHACGTTAHTAGLANFSNFYAADYEGRYLTGIAAGMKLNEMIKNGEITADEAKLGFVGAFPFAQVISAFTGFYLGARSVCPTVTMEVKHTGMWYGELEEQRAASQLIASGCKIISQYSDSPGPANECAEKNVPIVCYYTKISGISGADHLLASCKINWQPYFVFAMRAAIEGRKLAPDYTGTLANGSVVLNGLNQECAAPGTLEAIEAARAELITGTRFVFDTSAFTVNGEHLTEYLADVDDMGDYIPETQVISGGRFRESEFRSAPYFDIQIDGITGGGWGF